MPIKYTKRYIKLISVLVAIVIVVITSFSINTIQSNIGNKPNIEASKEKVIEVELNNKKENKATENKTTENKTTESKATESKWNVEIPKIELNAPILEGTSKEVMDEYVAHFSETSKEEGNVGLIAHNRGFPLNYFARLKELIVGDEITYTCNTFSKKYIVSDIGIIEDTNWSLLEPTNENILTLITCVENEPDYRRYVQAIEYTELIGE